MKGQTFTLEAILTAFIILVTLYYLIISFPLTNLQKVHITDDVYVRDVFNFLENKTLKESILCWNGKVVYGGASADDFNESFNCSTELKYYLKKLLDDKRFAYNIYVTYSSNGSLRELKFVYDGSPPPNAISLSKIVVIYDWDNGSIKSIVPDDFDSYLYNVLYVKVVVWRV